MTDKARSNREAINNLILGLNLGQITYAEAKEKAKPILDEINAKSKEIAKKYGRSHRNLTFEEIMR